MEKKLFPIFFLPFVLALASCGNAPAGEEGVDELKALLQKQDLSPIYTKMFTSFFLQDYNVFARTVEDEEQGTRFYTYRGGGAFGCLYEVDEEAYAEVNSLENPNFFDYLVHGKGSYGLVQTADLLSYDYEVEGEEVALDSLKSQFFIQQLDANFGEGAIQVSNSLRYQDKTSEEYNPGQSFNGIIDKKLLFDTITVRAFSEIFAHTNLYDGQRTCETLDRIYFEVLRGLNGKTDAELADFIAKNHIRIDEDEEGHTLVHFKIEEESLRDTLVENDIMPGDFEGTLTYEKDSGKFTAYDYKIVYVVEESVTSDVINVNSASMEFSASGYSWNQRYEDDLYIEPDPVVYTDADAFLEDIVKEVIPPLF
ncbi:MAG: hypothetical protein J6O18_03375 [Bacilli bacterium]|nr:hypothetical protein [Bacilli bacterium]